MTTTLDLIRAVGTGDSRSIKETFTALMDQKINDAIDVRTDEVRAQMFATESEEINELSKTTLGSYVKGAAQDYANKSVKDSELSNARDQVSRLNHNTNSETRKSLNKVEDNISDARRKNSDKKMRRGYGISQAVNRLTK